MQFVVVAIDKDNSLALRMAVREAHFAYVRSTGVVRIGGPFLDADGEMNGSLIIFEADSLEAAKARARSTSARSPPRAHPTPTAAHPHGAAPGVADGQTLVNNWSNTLTSI